jgi:hypothetical protein
LTYENAEIAVTVRADRAKRIEVDSGIKKESGLENWV